MTDYTLNDKVQWGKNLIPTLNAIFNKLSEKLDDINTTINNRIDDVNANIKATKDELLEKIVIVQKTADLALKKAEESKKLSEELELKFDKIDFYCENLKTENTRLKGQVNHLDNYSRRNNLVIGGIAENTEDTAEHCEQLARTFFTDKLKLDAADVDQLRIMRCHRLGRKNDPRNKQPNQKP